MEKLFTTSFETKALDEDRTIEFVATKEIVDYDGEVVSVKGMDTGKFEKAGVILWAHNQKDLPIGKPVSTKKVGDELIVKVKFTSEDENPFGNTVYKLIKGGYLKGVSVGFGADMESISYDKTNNARIINKSVLHELSVVPVGANSAALATGKSLKDAVADEVITTDELKTLDSVEFRITALEDKIKELEQKLAANPADELDSYIDAIFKEFRPAGGGEKSSDAETNSLDDLLDEFFEDDK